MTTMRLSTLCVVVLGAAASAIAFAPGGAGGDVDPAEIARKQERLRSVVAELSSRDVSHLSDRQRDARARALALLSDYADRADFTLHREPWPREIPLFIDDHGTRCALAAVLDGFHEHEVVSRLARECNDAYLAEIAGDLEIARCLDDLGLSIDEAAYIQGPGAREDRRVNLGPRVASRPDADRRNRTRNGRSSRTPGGDSETGEPIGARVPVRDAPSGGDDASSPESPVSPGSPASPASRDRSSERAGGITNAGSERADGSRSAADSAVPPAGGLSRPVGPATGSRRAREASSSFTWGDWWAASRDEFVQVRARYHAPVAAPATPDAPARPNRPTVEEIRSNLLPLFSSIAGHDRDLRSTALAMWARGASPDDRPLVLAAALAFLADPHEAQREWGLVMLAMLADPAAQAPLGEIVKDSAAGRRLLAQSGSVPEMMRALAAIAYGRCGGPIDLLRATVADAPAAHLDLASAAVVAIGLAGRDPAQRTTAVRFLVSELERPTLPPQVLAQVPAALSILGDPAALPALHGVVARFRGPRELRTACALALGRIAPELDAPVHEALAALARRDVDAGSRHAAILALGLVAARSGDRTQHDEVARLAAFHADALAGRFRQDEDLAWHALAAGLFVRGRPVEGRELLPALRDAALDGGDPALRAAACLALGLARDLEAAPLLLDAIEHDDDGVASFAAQALGLAGFQSARPLLLDLCLSTPSEPLGYSAAFALGCLAEPGIVDPLVERFERTPSAATRAALARALGEIGDRCAIEGLRRVALDERRDLPTRERAVAALGVLAQADDAAWNEPIKRSLVPGVVTPSLDLLLELF